MFVSIDRPKHVSADNKLAQRTNQSRAAVSGDQVGLAHSLRQGHRAPEERAARRRHLESRDRSQSSPRRCKSNRAGTGRRTGSDQDWEEQTLPDGPMTVGIDGGFVRAANKEGWFEVIAGKSVVAFRRDENEETPSAKCFGFVQTYDEKPRRRLWELLRSQGMQENQQVALFSIVARYVILLTQLQCRLAPSNARHQRRREAPSAACRCYAAPDSCDEPLRTRTILPVTPPFPSNS